MARTIKVELPEDGEGKFVEILNPLHLRRKEMKAFEKGENESDQAYSDRFLTSVVIGGNLVAEDGHTLSYPLSDSDLEEMTNYHVIGVMNAYKDAIDGAVPKN